MPSFDNQIHNTEFLRIIIIITVIMIYVLVLGCTMFTFF